MKILIAPNAFKNSLDAASAAKAIEEGLQQSKLRCHTQCFPVGDGGDGTGTLLTQLWDRIFIRETAHDPLGRKIYARLGWIEKEKTAIIEMAEASGLKLVSEHERNPLMASSYGTGELIKKALDKNAEQIILCVGGSATTDGGCGILEALGVRFKDAHKKIFFPLPADLIHLAEIDLSAIDNRICRCECIILCDVKNPLLGINGSAAIFGPQKGASPIMVQQLEASLIQMNMIIHQQLKIDVSSLPSGGAAGGVAAGLHAVIKAKLVHGIDYFLDHTTFSQSLQNAQLIITGEGSLDLQTLDGKAPYGIAVRAYEKNIPVIGMGGMIAEGSIPALQKYFDELININAGYEFTNLQETISATAARLTKASFELGNRLAQTQQ